MNKMAQAWHSVKSLAMRWSRTSSWFSVLLGSTDQDYRAMAGDGRTNAAVMACVRWVQRALPEAPLIVMQRDRKGDLSPVPEHGLQTLLENPNPHYSGLHLISAIVADLMLTGNAYIRKVRAGGERGRVVQLWWIPSTLIEPMWPDNDPSVYISHYEYQVEGNIDSIDPANIIHIRQGFDPNNVRKGLSDLAALYREIATDNEAANWTASMVRNVTPPGVVISPGKDVSLTPEDAEQIKGEFSQKFGGDRKGTALVLSAEANVQVLSFSPEQMNLRDIRNVPEERITAVFGIPAAVVGLGTGLEQTKVGATLDAMERQAYKSCLIPMQRLIVSELQMQLIPDFGEVSRLRVMFDLDQVSVLQEDQNALHERARADLLAGGITLNQFLTAIGEEPLTGPEGDVRYIPSTVTVTETTKLLEVPEPAPADEPAPRALAAAGARNGHAKAAVLVDATGFGPALVLSEDDLDRLSKVGPADLDSAEEFWRRAVDGSGLEDLIDARPDEGDADGE